MYIEIRNDYRKLTLISRKLYKRMGKPDFVHISRIKGKDEFIMIPMSKEQSEKIVCSPIVKYRSGSKETAGFYWTIPSLELFKTVTGINPVISKIVKVSEIKIIDKTYFKLCTD